MAIQLDLPGNSVYYRKPIENSLRQSGETVKGSNHAYRVSRQVDDSSAGPNARGGFFLPCFHGGRPMTSLVLNADDIQRAITRIAHEILEKNKGVGDLALVGIRTRGVTFAERLQSKIQDIEKTKVDLGILDITLYRDDIGTSSQKPELKRTEIDFPIEGKRIVLCDDVLFTGRTIRAAIDALMDFGRPSLVQLAVLIDRGHRELPFRPDYVGKNIPTSREMRVQVQLQEVDGNDQVVVVNQE